MNKVLKVFLLTGAAAIIGLAVNGTTVHMQESLNESREEAVLEQQSRLHAWSEWAKAHAHTISTFEPVKSVENPEFDDLAFLKPLLEGQRLVGLGEASHGGSEYNSVKVRLVQFLHEELGFNVLAFESNLGDTSTAYAQVQSKTPQETMENSIFGVWKVEENLPLFEYIAEQSKTKNPLILTGFDAQGTTEGFIRFVESWFAEVDPHKASAFSATERWYLKMHMMSDPEKFELEKKEIMTKYIALQRFVEDHKEELGQVHKNHPQLVPILERVLRNRLDMLDTYLPSMVELLSGVDPEMNLKKASYERDRIMADNTAWLANRLYPNEKIILWGHNYHIRKHNSTMLTEHNGYGFDSNPYPTMGEMLPFSLSQKSYIIGLYAYEGSSNKNNQQVEEIRLPHRPGSLEDILGKGDGPARFIDLKHQKWNEATAWMYSPRTAKAWGVLEETMIPRDQYDGILFIQNLHPSKRVQNGNE